MRGDLSSKKCSNDDEQCRRTRKPRIFPQVMKKIHLEQVKRFMDLINYHLLTDHGVPVPISRTKIDNQPNIWTERDQLEFTIAKSILPKNNSHDVLERLNDFFPGMDDETFDTFQETVLADTETKYETLVDTFLDQMKKENIEYINDSFNVENSTQETSDDDIEDENTTISSSDNTLNSEELLAYLKISLLLKKIRKNIKQS